jgi:hypothetical protein
VLSGCPTGRVADYLHQFLSLPCSEHDPTLVIDRSRPAA